MLNHKLILSPIALLALTFPSSDVLAASANGTATAMIVTPIVITSTQNLAFGKIDAAGAGTVVISTAGARSKTGSVALVSSGSTQNQGVFHVTGDGNSTYTISLPGSAATIDDGAGHTMTVDNFTSNPNGTGTLSSGAQDINVGGTLNVGNAQAPGSYSGTFSVSVDYN